MTCCHVFVVYCDVLLLLTDCVYVIILCGCVDCDCCSTYCFHLLGVCVICWLVNLMLRVSYTRLCSSWCLCVALNFSLLLFPFLSFVPATFYSPFGCLLYYLISFTLSPVQLFLYCLLSPSDLLPPSCYILLLVRALLRPCFPSNAPFLSSLVSICPLLSVSCLLFFFSTLCL
jgi:hypothetical protein